ncbi:hypothetical protein BaRGS_00015276 [Batillaria attramentaria]|uniref:Uncharacterized protein n=1 Tax=Batillaria attramentaria TaxID=370345 RepID=A0ABD0L280_9CAEN
MPAPVNGGLEGEEWSWKWRTMFILSRCHHLRLLKENEVFNTTSGRSFFSNKPDADDCQDMQAFTGLAHGDLAPSTTDLTSQHARVTRKLESLWWKVLSVKPASLDVVV